MVRILPRWADRRQVTEPFPGTTAGQAGPPVQHARPRCVPHLLPPALAHPRAPPRQLCRTAAPRGWTGCTACQTRGTGWRGRRSAAASAQACGSAPPRLLHSKRGGVTVRPPCSRSLRLFALDLHPCLHPRPPLSGPLGAAAAQLEERCQTMYAHVGPSSQGARPPSNTPIGSSGRTWSSSSTSGKAARAPART